MARPMIPLDRLGSLAVKPRNIYVAASVNDQSEARRVALCLQDAGFTVTSSWLRIDFSSKPAPETWPQYPNWMEHWGTLDFKDVMRSDTIVLLAGSPSSSGGYHVELGIALGAKIPNIVVIANRVNVFYWIKNVRYAKSVEGLVDWLRDSSHGIMEEWPENREGPEWSIDLSMEDKAP